ncbi:uncharacterized protein ATNIH1004_005853 [Aspergillus tanneri]|uniref:GED domain-containing protein n=1 Tax=Aspergillus tanneri TaxID=1220188 RepID=A0A5M9MJG8_9EURO|nr:uncharacterized protein ATNIH1004_005853 [Aspergillus tanneri]KAA8647165.1 hypothetical protein ATNIH1004_005853 [Aspergillus tanneri]
MSSEALLQLQSEQSKLLDGIDELRTIGVGGLVELPQLIVCGNQSSGKSSVLEAISRVRFPAKSNVCTRFATEVILRRHPSSTIKVSIEPGPKRTDPEEIQRLKSFAPKSFSDSDDLKDLINKAKDCMGITDSANVGFSEDVLKVEISGPEQPELTLVDLPGLYHSTSNEQSAKDRDLVHDITKRYMKNTRSIILAVISAKNDYHHQTVLNIAKDIDTNCERTLGIITHPDITEPNSEEEDNYLQFVNNEKVRLELGWHVLRNRSFQTQDFSDEKRDEHEREFFNKGRWKSVSRNSVGIDSLRSRLSSILLKHIRRCLPDLITDINNKVDDRLQKLDKLGPPRTTLQQQKGFLLKISSRFERITAQALNGMYDDEFFGGFDQNSHVQDFRRLRAVIRSLNEDFAEAMEIRGCRRHILESMFDTGPNIHVSPSNQYLEGWKPTTVPRYQLEEEVTEQARKSRGIELPGSPNQLLVGSLFRDQSKPWEEIAQRHLLVVWRTVRYFVSEVLQHLTDEHTYTALIGAQVDPELNRMQQTLLDKLAELTAHLKSGHPLPVGKNFLTRIQKARQERQLNQLKSSLGKRIGSDAGLTIGDLEQATAKLEVSGEFAPAEIIDEMQAYYDTAIVTFVDNVATLAIENCLLGPLGSMFTSQTINNMEDKQVQELAREPAFICDERDRLNNELEKLQAGLRTFNPYNIQKPPMPGFVMNSADRDRLKPSVQADRLSSEKTATPQSSTSQSTSKQQFRRRVLADTDERKGGMFGDLGTARTSGSTTSESFPRFNAESRANNISNAPPLFGSLNTANYQ